MTYEQTECKTILHLEQGIVGQVLLGELALACVTRVSLTEHGVAIARHDIATLQSLPDEVLELIISGRHADGTHNLGEPYQHLDSKHFEQLNAMHRISCDASKPSSLTSWLARP